MLSALRAGRLLPPGRFLVLISVRDRVDPRATVRLEGLRQLKNPMSSSEIESATFRLIAKCLNELCYGVSPLAPPLVKYSQKRHLFLLQFELLVKTSR
jgi:hypothetical protein